MTSVRLSAFSSRFGARWLVWFPLALGLLAAAALSLLGTAQTAEDALREARDAANGRSASGKVAVVEVDAQSLAAVSRWPWPRSVHAALVDRLREAGASTIAFDVDFSSASNPADDAAFAAALERAGGSVVLPIFRQRATNGSDRFHENFPIPALRQSAMLAAVNVRPEADGRLVSYGYGSIIDGAPRPSMASALAGRSGRAGEHFRIDTAVDPKSLPRFSARDVLDGRLPRGAVDGKAVMIGSTAIELGDHYALPGHGLLPGVVAQAMAAETLIAGRDSTGMGALPALALVIAALAALSRRRSSAVANVWRLAMLAILVAAPFAFDRLALPPVDVVPALVVAIVEWVASAAIALQARVRHERLTDVRTGLPNQRAFLRTTVSGDVTIVVARTARNEELDTLFDEDIRAALTVRVVERLATGFPGCSFHLVGPGIVAWICPGVDPGDVVSRVQSTSALFVAPLMAGARAVLVTPTFGIAGGSGDAVAQLLAEASLASRTAQDNGQRWAVHNAAATDAAHEALTLLADLDGALDNGDIHIVFQPKLDIATGAIAGAESLVRWKHPVLGPIPPDRFIPLLEDSGNIARLTLFVIDGALAELTRWRLLGLGGGLAVNVSAGLLDDAGFVADLERRLGDAPQDAARLTLEVTETAALTEDSAPTAVLARLRTLGAKVSIDDYGTGRATLTYLHAFPADEIKIDKSFVTGLLADDQAQIMVRSTITMAHELGLRVVAEGIEDAATLAQLEKLGCDTGQGWHIGKPMPADALRAMLSSDGSPARIAA